MVLHIADVSEIGRYEVGSCGSLVENSRILENKSPLLNYKLGNYYTTII